MTRSLALLRARASFKSAGKSPKDMMLRTRKTKSTTTTTTIGGGGGGGGVLLDNSYLCFEYHRAIVAGLTMVADTGIGGRSGSRSSGGGGGKSGGSGGGSGTTAAAAPLVSPAASAFVIGLGGGALPMSLHHFFPDVRLTVAELDPSVVQVAKEWFGFREEGHGLCAQVCDGLLVDYGAEGSNAFVVVDVDSKDNSVGMSCPPQAFLESSFLLKVKASLRMGGVLAVNVAARSADMYRQALTSITRAFAGSGDGSKVYFLKAAEDDVNTVIFAVKGSTPAFSVTTKAAAAAAAAGSKGKKKSSAASSPTGTTTAEIDLKSRIRGALLKVPGQSDDPLGLLEMIEGLTLT